MTHTLFIIMFVSIFYCTGTKTVKEDLGPVIGIDLGTTYSCVGIFKNCHVEIIENDQGNRITPSYIAVISDGERLTGDGAKNLLTENPANTIFHVKRLIGRNFNDSSVQQDIKNFPFSITEKNNQPVIKVNTESGEKIFTPEEISAMILGKMRTIAAAYLGQKIRNAVVTVPAYFNNAQRQATKIAGEIAGLNVLRIINEPTAAAIAYGLNKLSLKEGTKHVIVFDLGGGTFDVSLLTLNNGVFEVLATNGDTHLDGEDFDQRVIDHLIKLFQTKTGKYTRINIRSLQILRREVERAKRTLSSQYQTKIEIESFIPNEDFSETLTRAKFEELNIDLFKSTLIPVEKVMEDANLEKTDISEIILVGGSTRIPKIRQIIEEYFDGKKPSIGVNPDEAVAYGAAILGGVLSGEDCTNDIVVLDVNPLTLGIETRDGVMSELIPRNSHIPIAKTKPFITISDNQDAVTIRVYEGERSMTKDNHFLGKFDLTGIPLALRGTPRIDVTFDIDVNGILNVTAQERTKGNKKNIVINSKTNRLSSIEINRMIKDAERFAVQNKTVKDRLDARNEFESYVYSLKNQLADKTKPLGMLSTREEIVVEYYAETQIRWLDGNPNAKTEDLIARTNQLQKITINIINEFIPNSPSNEARPSAGSYNDEL